MILARRGWLGGALALLAAPAIIRTPGLLMPVRPALTRLPWLFRSDDDVWDGMLIRKWTITEGELRVRVIPPEEFYLW